MQKPVCTLDAINTFVIFPNYTVGLYCTICVQKLELIPNSVFCCVISVVPVRAHFPIVNLPKCNLVRRPRDVEVN
jgi:hypothetical protein